jgi:hypothetical protein
VLYQCILAFIVLSASIRIFVQIWCRSSFYGFFPSVVEPTLTQLLQHSNALVGGSFIATILETATVAVFYMAWRSNTEGAFRFFLLHLVFDVVAFCDILMPFYGFERAFMG